MSDTQATTNRISRTQKEMDRLWSKIEIPANGSSCWVWIGAVSSRYSRLGSRKKQWVAHRFTYELFRGPIPDGLQTDHLCRNTTCVNPWHLDLVTSRENTLRGQSPSARYFRRTHCINNHALTPENVRVISTYNNGQARICKTCARIRYERRRNRGA